MRRALIPPGAGSTDVTIRMGENTDISLPRPGGIVEDKTVPSIAHADDRWTLLRPGEVQVDAPPDERADQADDEGQSRILRDGHAAERFIQAGIGQSR